ncbi:Sulfate/thiosulfate import ATP-binding protein CysA [Fundidesulfovibrio magnetotacticus]|uniref:Sulfate/thiosulfate import ATP-binding protein CysA n=1 Tax=Fundidesulfovibrio magnetotacticus TaxID=2730080 RepID=A0A6V8LVT3_9BACT|nr:ATP-binding cassette domain-containing protein [Fundidesulfovibrio magnetotacticus]GFK94701.1 Sulfate/thiosulfate import ATP-binding protein CysA [Fundidesulfovibrio magnetotacticus]
MNLSARVRKRLERFTLDVDLSFTSPGVHAVVGPSGAGKSTLLRLLAGLERPDEGAVRLDATTWCDTDSGRFLHPWERSVGLVFQDFGLFAHLSLFDNVLFAKGDRFRAEALMRALDIWQLRFARPSRVSGGERQRCAVCQALARKPGALLLDEPFSALDPVTRRSLGSLLRRCALSLAIPVVLVTHDMEEALRLADSVTCLVDGREAGDWLDNRLEAMRRDLDLSREYIRQRETARRLEA